jgi:hypothetical protein
MGLVGEGAPEALEVDRPLAWQGEQVHRHQPGKEVGALPEGVVGVEERGQVPPSEIVEGFDLLDQRSRAIAAIILEVEGGAMARESGARAYEDLALHPLGVDLEEVETIGSNEFVEGGDVDPLSRVIRLAAFPEPHLHAAKVARGIGVEGVDVCGSRRGTAGDAQHLGVAQAVESQVRLEEPGVPGLGLDRDEAPRRPDRQGERNAERTDVGPKLHHGIARRNELAEQPALELAELAVADERASYIEVIAIRDEAAVSTPNQNVRGCQGLDFVGSGGRDFRHGGRVGRVQRRISPAKAGPAPHPYADLAPKRTLNALLRTPES